MLRIRRLLISLTAAVAAGALVYAIYVALLKQVEMKETRQVIVPARFIPQGTVLTEQLLKQRAVLAAAVDGEMITRFEEAVGKQALIPLGAGEPVLKWKLSSHMVLPSAGESAFEIPREYIRSISGGIREGDFVRVYVSSEQGGRRLLVEDVRVASVKLSIAGRDGGSPELREEAADGHQQLLALRAGHPIERINLILTEEQWLAIDEACQGEERGKLIIALPGDAGPEPAEGWNGGIDDEDRTW